LCDADTRLSGAHLRTGQLDPRPQTLFGRSRPIEFLLAHHPSLQQFLSAPSVAFGIGEVDPQIAQRCRRCIAVGHGGRETRPRVRIVERGKDLPLPDVHALFREDLVDAPGDLGRDRGATAGRDISARVQECRPPTLVRAR
jgi:hypothetical protein